MSMKETVDSYIEPVDSFLQLFEAHSAFEQTVNSFTKEGRLL